MKSPQPKFQPNRWTGCRDMALQFSRHFQMWHFLCKVQNEQKDHNSATSPPIWLKFWLWAFHKIPLGPFETNFCPNSTPSMVDGSGDKTQIERGVQWIFFFLQKYAMKLILEPNFFCNIILIIGLYYALESSGLQTQPFMSYSNGWTDRTSQYCNVL